MGEKHDPGTCLGNGSRGIDDVPPKYNPTTFYFPSLKHPKSSMTTVQLEAGSSVEGEGICKGGHSSGKTHPCYGNISFYSYGTQKLVVPEAQEQPYAWNHHPRHSKSHFSFGFIWHFQPGDRSCFGPPKSQSNL